MNSLNVEKVSWIDMLVPQIILLEEPPMSFASEVLGSRFENVRASDPGAPSRTGTPFSSTNRRRRRLGVEPNTSEWMSPLREAFTPFVPGTDALEALTNIPLLLVGISAWERVLPSAPRPGLELEAYLRGDESKITIIGLSTQREYD